MTSIHPPTGAQHRIERGSASATIASVAASLRHFERDGVQLTPGYPEDVTPPFGCGIVLVPWPNRVEDGRWTLDGDRSSSTSPSPTGTTPSTGSCATPPTTWSSTPAHAVTLAATMWPQHGYPFLLETDVRYELVDDGLRVTHRIRNRSDRPAPVALGAHPFFTIGDVAPEDLVLTVHAATRIEVDERLNPVGTSPIDPRLRAGLPLREVELDHAFADLDPVDGAVASLTAPDGRSVALVQDEQHRWMQVFTTRAYPGTSLAVAIEPMTAPMNALVTGEGLRWVEPGEEWTAWWGVRVTPDERTMTDAPLDPEADPALAQAPRRRARRGVGLPRPRVAARAVRRRRSCSRSPRRRAGTSGTG